MTTRLFRTFLPIMATVALLGAAGTAGATHGQKTVHHLAIQVDSDDPALMNLALNNAVNAAEHYTKIGETVEIEIVTYGPGLHMLRADTSPVKERIKTIADTVPNVSFAACGNTIGGMKKRENKQEIVLLPEASVVPAGVVRLMELQEKGWTYIRP